MDILVKKCVGAKIKKYLFFVFSTYLLCFLKKQNKYFIRKIVDVIVLPFPHM